MSPDPAFLATAVEAVVRAGDLHRSRFRAGVRIDKKGTIDLVTDHEPCHVMLFGGETMESKRYIWWNFVSSSKERIEQAKEEWRTGKFDIVPGDEEEFIPLPVD